jgi:hypothetical protein
MKTSNAQASKKIETFDEYQSVFFPKQDEKNDISKYSAEEAGVKMAERTILFIRELLEDRK